MADDRNLDLALRIRAEVDQAKAALKQVQSDIDGVGAATQKTSAAANHYTETASRQVRVMQQAASAGARQAAALKLMGEIDPVGSKLDRLDELGARLNALHKSNAIGVEDYQHLSTVLTAHRSKLMDVGKTTSATAKTERELAFAMRGLPAQITDITTSLATGQPPLRVFLQQGGQLKDMFGGVVPAARAMGRSLLGLVNPYTLVAAAVIGAAAAFVKGQAESAEFYRTLISVGGIAEVTGAQLHDMAGSLQGGTIGQAKQVMLQLAATGKYTGDQLRLAGQAALDMSRVTGQSLEASVKAITALRDDPVDAIQKLNEQFHFLDTATFQQIQRLRDLGDEQAAADLAEQTYADSLRSRAKQVEESLGTMQRDWETLKQIASDAWDAMQGIGRPPIGSRDELDAGYEALLRKRQAVADALHGGPAAAGPMGWFYAPEIFGANTDQLKSELDSLDQSLANLRDGMADLDRQAEKTANAASANQRGIAASSWADKALKGYDKIADKAKATQIVAQKMWDIIYSGGQLPEGVHVSKGPGGGFAGAGFDYMVNQLLGGSGGRSSADQDARKIADAAAKAQDALTNALIKIQTQADPTAAAYARYNDQVKAAKEWADNAKKATDANTDAINVQRDAVIAGAQAELAAAKQKIEAQRLADQDKAVRGLMGHAPNGYSVPPEVGGAAGELLKLQQRMVALDQWHMKVTQANEIFRMQDLRNEQKYQENLAQIDRTYRERKAAADQAAHQLSLAAAEEGFGSLANAMASFYGQQSAQYRAAFVLQKTAALVHTIMNIKEAASTALAKSGNPWLGFANMALIISQGAELVAAIRGVSFSGGGWTGPGGKYQPAGIVHADEGVLTKEDMAALGGPSGFYALRDAIRNGYADGGVVQSPFASAPSPAALGFRSQPATAVNAGKLMVAVTPVTVIVHGGSDDVKSQQSTDSDGGQVLELFLGAVAKNVQDGGVVAQAADRRWILQRKSNSYG